MDINFNTIIRYMVAEQANKSKITSLGMSYSVHIRLLLRNSTSDWWHYIYNREREKSFYSDDHKQYSIGFGFDFG